MSPSDGIEIEMDRKRRLKFRVTEARELSRRLGGVSTVALVAKLAELDLEAITVGLQLGLRHEDKKLTVETTDDLVQGFLDRGGRLVDLSNAVSEALEACGVFRFRSKEAEDARPSP